MSDWADEISDLIEIAERFGLSHVSEDLAYLREELSRSAYRVAFLGHSSAGKSSLINSLLGFPLLRVRAVPTNERVTLIRSGQRDSAGSVVPDDSGHVPSVVERVIPVESPWLRTRGLELVDTPGLDSDEVGVDRPHTAETTAAASDVAVLVVRAVGGFDLRERALLSTLAAMRRPDPPLIVITMLDGVNDDLVLRRARGIGRAAGPGVEVFEGPGVDLADSGFSYRVEALRSRLSVLAGHRRRQGRPVGDVLLQTCSDLDQVAEEGLRAATLETPQRTVILERIRAQRGASRALWAMLKTELEPRASQLVDRITEDTHRLGGTLAEKYAQELAGSPSPAARWTEISAQINEQFAAHDTAMGRLLHEAFAETAQWVDRRLAGRALSDDDTLDELAETPLCDGPLGEAPAPSRPGGALSAATIELIAEAVAESVRTVASAGLALAAPPVIPAANALGGLLSRGATQFLQKRVQQSELRAAEGALNRFVDDWTTAITGGAASQTAQLFTRLVEAGEQRHDTWWRTREQAWDDSVPIDRWTALRSDAARAKRQITERLREIDE
ncbi:dynamin family protein [Catenuloplanes indicus]|uniref:G domain-containing protein n=1 Tax=Catenuloplanes indicus TaxID=137267 RepID=A0AAE3VVQ1_9ACTN|nr:dynamin family protein [Catenuloplanes indicus]MDQ0365113.1 hypothetical protein [Catenuloplanes indicus]